jgi:hypothetical protein
VGCARFTERRKQRQWRRSIQDQAELLLYAFHIPSSRMLYIIGLGLADEKDVSVKGLEIIKRAERVYLEAYTAILLVDQQQLVRCIAS